jgi:hypothetical protein
MTTFNDTVEAPVFQTIGGKAVVRGDNGGVVRLFHPVGPNPHIELIANESTLDKNTGGGLVNVADGAGDTTIQLNGHAGAIGIGTTNPDRPLTIQAQGASQELISLKDPSGATKWHINQDLGGSNPGLNFVETGVADGRLFLKPGGNVGIGTTNPAAKLDVRGDILLPHAQLGQRSLGGGFLVLTQANNTLTLQLDQNTSPAGGPGGGIIGVFGPSGNDAVHLTQNTSGGGGVSLFSAGANETMRLGQDNSDGGGIPLFGPSGGLTVGLSGALQFPDKGIVNVTDETGVHTARITFDSNGNSAVIADIKHFSVPHPMQSDTDIVYACIEGPEAGVYIRGTGHLVNGEAFISLPDHFVSVASPDAMTVRVTPLSADSLGLAVVAKRISGVEVKELQRGTGNYDFDWEIKCVRSGHEDYRVTRSRNEVALPALANTCSVGRASERM